MRSSPSPRIATLLCFLATLSGTATGAPPGRQGGIDDSDWSAYGGDQEGSRFASAAQINPSNVTQLREVWRYRTGELGAGFAHADKLAFSVTPILAAGSLYLSTPTSIVIAIDPITGRERWRYDPHIPRNVNYREASSHGVSSWFDPQTDSSTACSHRIFLGTLDARLLAIDGRNGQPCQGFGLAGTIDLTTGMPASARGTYNVNSPPVLYRELVIVGTASSRHRPTDVGHSVVRAFDVRSGELRWSWNPASPQAASRAVPHPNSDVIRTGPTHTWSSFAVDAGRGIVFVPTGATGLPGSPTEGSPIGEPPYANSLIALRAQSGEVIWHQQLVHRDLWGYDIAAQPLLVDVERDGKSIAAVVQATPTGQLFVFDRETGEPVYEVVERTVPATHAPGTPASPTQPFAATPSLVSHAAIVPQDAWGLTFIDRSSCREQIKRYRSEGLYTPPSPAGALVTPGDGGGVGWGSLAFDGERQLAIAAVNHLPSIRTLTRRGSAGYEVQHAALLSPLGLPCTAPPWGTLAAVDLRRNSIRWQVVLGSTRDSTPWYVPRRSLGMPNRGGPIATAGGLVFIAAAADNYLRAFHIDTGRELWRGRLPAGGQATPMSYEINGRQFVVIAAGGDEQLRTTRGDFVVAFALPP